MLLVWNPDYPPAHNETVMYKCNAGPTYNRFVSDYSKYNYTLTCLPDNQFSTPEWPVCADCKLNIGQLRKKILSPFQIQNVQIQVVSTMMS